MISFLSKKAIQFAILNVLIMRCLIYSFRNSVLSRKLYLPLRHNHYISQSFQYKSKSSSLDDLVLGKVSGETLKSPQLVFVGGKGGVGKTTSSSAIALKFSESGYRTLIVSTDPAHSLGDALDYNLSEGLVTIIPTERGLYALEIDIQQSLDQFKEFASSLNINDIAKVTGVPINMLESLGLDEVASFFESPPPGIDEIAALIKIFDLANINGGESEYERIVIDTAPTGHTLRLLQLPEFLDNFTTKLLQLKTKLDKGLQMIRGFFGGEQDLSGANKMEQIVNKIETLQKRMLQIKTVLKDSKRTQFVVVTIPTQLAYLESKRLVGNLKKEDVSVTSIICNQVLSDNADKAYLNAITRGQKRVLESIRLFLSEYKDIEVTEVPYVNTEVTGLYGLQYFHTLAHAPKARSATNPIDSRKLTIFGGKGGVGKTTSAASWAVRLADSGFSTLVVSTDPAHSLGDSLQESLSGEPKKLSNYYSSGGGEIWAMEIDPSKALQEFKDLLEPITQANKDSFDSFGGLGEIKQDLGKLLFDVNDPPPGTDEIVAIAKVIALLDDGFVTPSGDEIKFERIVLDTAPTGHTLRMLELPPILCSLAKKLRNIRDKTNSVTSMFGMDDSSQDNLVDEFTRTPSASGSSSETKKAKTIDRILNFENRMNKFEQIIHDPKQAEFAVVSIATEVAAAETKRLIQSLKETNNILVRRLIVNQLIPSIEATDETTNSNTANAYIGGIRKMQSSALNDIQNLANQNDLKLIKVPYYDAEVRTVYGLKVISSHLFN